MSGNALEYFLLDVSMDDKIGLIEAEFGLTGFAVVVKLYQKIYGGQGYYCEWTKEVALLFARGCGLGGKVVSEIVEASVKRGIFDAEIFEKYHVLTSRGIQKRYFKAVSRRKEVTLKREYLVIELGQFLKNVDIWSENADKIPKNDDIFKQSIEEERRYASILNYFPLHANRYIRKAMNYYRDDEMIDRAASAWILEDIMDGAIVPAVSGNVSLEDFTEWVKKIMPFVRKQDQCVVSDFSIKLMYGKGAFG